MRSSLTEVSDRYVEANEQLGVRRSFVSIRYALAKCWEWTVVKKRKWIFFLILWCGCFGFQKLEPPVLQNLRVTPFHVSKSTTENQRGCRHWIRISPITGAQTKNLPLWNERASNGANIFLWTTFPTGLLQESHIVMSQQNLATNFGY